MGMHITSARALNKKYIFKSLREFEAEGMEHMSLTSEGGGCNVILNPTSRILRLIQQG